MMIISWVVPWPLVCVVKRRAISYRAFFVAGRQSSGKGFIALDDMIYALQLY